MPDMHLEITGGNSSAIAALTEVQAAIDALHGRSVSVDVNVNGTGAAVAGLAATGAASDAAAAAHGRNASAADRASSAMRDHAAASDRAGRSLGDLSSGAERAGRSFSEMSGSASEAERAMGGAKTFEDMWQALGHGSAGAVQASSSFEALGSSFRAVDEATGASARALEDLGGSGISAARGFEAVGTGAARGEQFMVGASGAAQSVSRDLVPLASSASRAGSAMGGAASGMKAATQNASGAYQIFNITGTAMHNAAAGANAISAGSSNASSSVSAFSNRLSNMTGQADRFLSSANLMGDAGAVLDGVGSAVKPLGIALGVGAIGMGALGAATAAVGIVGFGLDVSKSAGAMADLRDVTKAASSGFSAMKSETAAVAAPAIPGLVASVKGVSRELASLGVQSEPAILQGLTTLGTDATASMQKLAPAITPAINAATALGGAVVGSFGDSAGPIADFSNSVTAAAPGMQKTLDAMVGGLAKLGETGATVLGSSALKNIFQATGNVIGAGDDLFMGLGGYPSNQIGQKNAQGQPTQMSGLDRAGLALKGTAQLGLSAIDPFTAMGGGSLAQSGQYNLREARSGQTPPAPPGTDTEHHAVGLETPSGDTFGESYDPSQFHGGSPKAPMGDVAHGGLPGFSGPVAGPPPPRPMPRERASSARGPDTMQPDWNYGGPGAMTPGMGKPNTPPPAQVEAGRSVGSSLGLPSPTATNELNAALRQTPSAASAAQQSLQQVGPSANQSMTQAGQAAQHVPPAIQAAMSQVAPMTAQSMAQVAPAMAQAIPPSTVAAPMHSAVQQASQDVAPAASDAGSNIGASMTSGASSGVTKTETSTLTVVRKWLEKVIDEGASALDAHSPSRVFAALGESIPTGLAVGIDGSQGAAISAVQQVMQGTIGAAQSSLGTGGGGAQSALGGQAGTQLGQQFGQGYAGQLGSHLDGLNGQMAAHKDAMDNALGQDGHKNLIPPHQADAVKQAQDQKNALDQTANSHGKASDAASQHQKSMSELNAEQGKGNSLLDRQNAHNERAGALAQQRATLHDAAQYRAMHGDTPDSAIPMGQDKSSFEANAWRNPARDNTGAIVGGDMDNRIAVTKADQLKAAATPPPPANNQPATPKPVSPADMLSDNQLRTQGNANGAAYGQGTAAGVTSTNGQVNNAASNQAAGMVEQTKKQLAIASPSQVAADIGSNFGAGTVQGINSSTDGIESVASNTGLQVGYVYAQNMVTGVTSIMKSADFQTAAVSGIGSQLAETALGALGMLGPAGSGGEIYKNQAVTLAADSSSASTQPIVIELHTYLDGQPFNDKITTQIATTFNQLTNTLAVQAT